jgi:hypothetical protein
MVVERVWFVRIGVASLAIGSEAAAISTTISTV